MPLSVLMDGLSPAPNCEVFASLQISMATGTDGSSCVALSEEKPELRLGPTKAELLSDPRKQPCQGMALEMEV